MIPTASEFLNIIQPSAQKPSFAFGSIDSAYSSGNPAILFDGETVVSTKTYPFLSSYTPVASDRVVLARISGGYVVLGKFDGTSNPACRVYHSLDQSIPTGAGFTALAFDSERFDTEDMHDVATNNSRITCKTAGKYLIIGNIKWAANATGTRSVRILLNGSTEIAFNRVPNNGASTTVFHSVSSIYAFDVGHYVELSVQQNSGGALNATSYSADNPEFMMARVG